MPTLFDSLDNDPCRNRHGGNAESIAAHEKIRGAKTATYREILAFVQSCGWSGCTAKQYAAAKGVQLNTVSGRFSELRACGFLKDEGSRRDGAAVLLVNGEIPEWLR